MQNALRHFATALAIAIALWSLALATLLRMDSLSTDPSPLTLVAAVVGLFLLPSLTLGLWANSSLTLPHWLSARILLSWCVWLVPVALTLLIVRRVDAVALSFLASLTLPLIVLTGLWMARRHTQGTQPDHADVVA